VAPILLVCVLELVKSFAIGAVLQSLDSLAMALQPFRMTRALVFAAVVRLNASEHSWALEVPPYVLVVLTTLELRREFLR